MRIDDGRELLIRDYIVDASNSLSELASAIENHIVNSANYDFTNEEDVGYYSEFKTWFNSHRFMVELNTISEMDPEQYMCHNAIRTLRSYIYFLKDEMSYSWITPEDTEFYNNMIYKAQLKINWFTELMAKKESLANE